MITRKQYMENSSDKNFDWFNAYYSQFVNEDIKQAVLKQFGGVKKLAQCFSVDKHLNNLPLHKWDELPTDTLVDKKLLKEAGEGWSLSTGVCISKTAARMLIKESNV